MVIGPDDEQFHPISSSPYKEADLNKGPIGLVAFKPIAYDNNAFMDKDPPPYEDVDNKPVQNGHIEEGRTVL